jgi:hypothetical protein
LSIASVIMYGLMYGVAGPYRARVLGGAVGGARAAAGEVLGGALPEAAVRVGADESADAATARQPERRRGG